MKKIFLIVGLLVALVGLGVGVFIATRTNLPFLIGASPTAAPQEVKITNLSDNSFAVSWITPNKALVGFAGYGENPSLGQTALDDRDQQSGKTTDYFTHHVTIKNLQPETTYYFKIGSGSRFYDNNGTPYQVTTAPTTEETPPLADPAYGKILTLEGSPAADVIVYLTVADSTPLSATVNRDGNWLITLNNARTTDLTRYVTYQIEGSLEDIFVQGAGFGVARATADTNNDSPIPTMTLGKTYSLGKKEEKPKEESASPSAQATGKFSLQEITTPAPAEETVPPKIETPLPGEDISRTRPTFTGTGKPGETLTITVESTNPQTAKVVVGLDGKWSWTPSVALAAGGHTVTVADAGGKKDSQEFKVLGAQVTPTKTATSSATLPQAGMMIPTLILVTLGLFLIVLSPLLFFLRR